ncbi:hypothetical protein Landi51_07714 [Colletotrichum acutatum]
MHALNPRGTRLDEWKKRAPVPTASRKLVDFEHSPDAAISRRQPLYLYRMAVDSKFPTTQEGDHLVLEPLDLDMDLDRQERVPESPHVYIYLAFHLHFENEASHSLMPVRTVEIEILLSFSSLSLHPPQPAHYLATSAVPRERVLSTIADHPWPIHTKRLTNYLILFDIPAEVFRIRRLLETAFLHRRTGAFVPARPAPSVLLAPILRRLRVPTSVALSPPVLNLLRPSSKHASQSRHSPAPLAHPIGE